MALNEVRENRFRPLRDLRDALSALTRLPVGPRGDHGARPLAEAAWAFPVVGAVVGGIGGAVFALAAWLGLPAPVAALLCVGGLVAVTGAFHEDGLADVADGFGGGWDRESKLEIMRDSRIGTFGVIAVVLSLGLRATAIAALAEPAAVASAVIVAGAVSRAALLFVMRGVPPARTDGLGAGAGVPSGKGAAAAALLGLAAAIALLPLPVAGAAVVAVAVAAGALAVLARRQIGGFTGDVLGAVQQVTEIAVLLVVCALLEAGL